MLKTFVDFELEFLEDSGMNCCDFYNFFFGFVQAYFPLVKKRFKEPLFKMAASKKERKSKEGGDGDQQPEELKNKLDTSAEQFKRPSDYRRASLQQQGGQKGAETVGGVLKISEESVEGLFGKNRTTENLTTETPTKDSLLTELNNLIDVFYWFVFFFIIKFVLIVIC